MKFNAFYMKITLKIYDKVKPNRKPKLSFHKPNEKNTVTNETAKDFTF